MKNSSTRKEDPLVRILKIATCPSLSGRSTLTYHIGCDDKAAGISNIQFRIYENTGKGFFCDDWVPMQQIRETFEAGEPNAVITSASMNRIFNGKSVNTAGFLIAILKTEGVIAVTEDKRRRYEECDSVKFEQEMAKLIEAGIALKVNTAPALSLKVNKKVILKGGENPA